MNPVYAIVEGPLLPQDTGELEKLRSAAKDYIVSARWAKPEGPPPLKGVRIGKILYPKSLSSSSSWIQFIPLSTTPDMYLRAAEAPNEFVIMIVYDAIERDAEYVFNVDITTINPFLPSHRESYFTRMIFVRKINDKISNACATFGCR